MHYIRHRGLHLGMVDELAMACCAHQALMTRNYVERTVCVLKGILPPASPATHATLF